MCDAVVKYATRKRLVVVTVVVGMYGILGDTLSVATKVKLGVDDHERYCRAVGT
jgi:hypothetical protein